MKWFWGEVYIRHAHIDPKDQVAAWHMIDLPPMTTTDTAIEQFIEDYETDNNLFDDPYYRGMLVLKSTPPESVVMQMLAEAMNERKAVNIKINRLISAEDSIYCGIGSCEYVPELL